jgi:hypothetical protein
MVVEKIPEITKLILVRIPITIVNNQVLGIKIDCRRKEDCQTVNFKNKETHGKTTLAIKEL